MFFKICSFAVDEIPQGEGGADAERYVHGFFIRMTGGITIYIAKDEKIVV